MEIPDRVQVQERCRIFHELHASGCFVIPNPWDIGSAHTLEQLEIDARRVAVELNLDVVKKAAYDSSVIKEGDEVEIVNFVGGG